MLENFDPNAPTSSSDGIFGLPGNYENSQLILLPVPWEVTTSYGAGAAFGPISILKASHQLDLFSLQFGKAYEQGYFLQDLPTKILNKNHEAKEKAQWVMQQSGLAELEQGQLDELQQQIEQVNLASEELNEWVYENSKKVLADGKFCALVGGDHSTPYGQIKALSEHYNNYYSVLHIDAHHDLRQAYQSFTHSHASIFYNVMESDFAPTQLTQVAIRDFCEDEFNYAQEDERIQCFYDDDLKERLHRGETWKSICEQIAQTLPENVYISCDIDGFSPSLCPNTGTPVAGGLDFHQFTTLLKTLWEQNKRIIGFDLVEVAPDPQEISEMDGNVGARVLFQMAGWMMKTQGLID